jgi:ribosomal protein S12 methylthiotransferase accessory factor
MAEAVRLLAILREGGRGRASWLLDLTTDLAIPCVAALSLAAGGKGLACGFAARPTPEAAARAAILELCQMELGLLVALAKREERGEAALNAVDRGHVDRAARIAADHCALLHPLGAPGRWSLPACTSAGEELEALQAQLARHGIEAALVDLTRPDLGIPVACAIAPQLQLFPSRLPTHRLQCTIDATGGGECGTEALTLL